MKEKDIREFISLALSYRDDDKIESEKIMNKVDEIIKRADEKAIYLLLKLIGIFLLVSTSFDEDAIKAIIKIMKYNGYVTDDIDITVA